MEISNVIKQADRKLLDRFIKRIHPNFIFNHHHYKIIDLLERITWGENIKATISMPPRHGKSMICSESFPAYYLANHPERYLIACSYGGELASDFGRKVRNTMSMEAYKEITDTRVARDSNSVNRFNTTNRGQYIAVGANGTLTGRGGHTIIVDDPHKNHEDSSSETQTQKLWNWYTTTLLTRLQPGGNIVVIGTRWSEIDLIARIRENDTDGEWEHLVLPALDEDNNALWEEWIPAERLLSIKKEIGTRHFEALYQQNPTPLEGSLIKKEWIKYYDEPPRYFEDTLMSWDLTFKGTKDSDWVVGTVWGKSGTKMYLIDLVRGKWDFTETIKQFVALCRKYPNVSRKIIEDKANGPALMDHLKDRVMGLIPWTPTGSKEGRLHAVAPFFEAGNILIPSWVEWKGDYVRELLSFPNGKHDDQVDSTSMAILNLKDSGGITVAGTM